MRFEVEVDDGAQLNLLHKARAAYNQANAQQPGFEPAADMPTFVQRLTDQAVAGVLAPLETTTLPQALARIDQLQTEKTALEQVVAARTLQVGEAKPA